ncbi:MAG TPA: hypothetical protein VFH51_14985 [Myxococcota bacterium]|nr:hypothetical protein [Myxococcota bacterium]
MPPRAGATQRTFPAVSREPAGGFLVGLLGSAALLGLASGLNGNKLPCDTGVAFGLLWGGTVIGGAVGSLFHLPGEPPTWTADDFV